MSNTKLAPGDRIRLSDRRFEYEDYTVEEFCQCLGVFESNAHREAGVFTPLCDLYELGPESVEKYIGNFGSYYTNKVPRWMNLPKQPCERVSVPIEDMGE